LNPTITGCNHQSSIRPNSASVTSIYQKVLGFIDTPDPAAFEPLALEIFDYQFSYVSPYHAYCTSLGITPRTVRKVAEIPPVSTVAFKYASIENRNEPPSSASRMFFTSGTTIGKSERGRHLVPRPEVYRASALNHLRRMLFPDSARTAMLSLHPTADRMRESSLSQMISWCSEEFGNGVAMCAATPQAVDAVAAIQFLRESTLRATPVSILGTTASFDTLFAAMDTDRMTLVLPPGSRLMDTGGAKGQAVPLDAAQVAELATCKLGIATDLVINEYGMTEMCSQLYDATRFNSSHSAAAGKRVKLAPPWLRASALDPVTLSPVPDGEIGLLAFFDLANVGAVSALMTEDLCIVSGDGVAIVGRVSGDPRGCALAIEEYASREHALAANRPIA
jgi:hypothetical protein